MGHKHTSVLRVEHEADERVTPVVVKEEYWFRVLESVVVSGAFAKLNGCAQGVLVILYYHVNREHLDRTGEYLAWPSVTTIATLVGVQERAVAAALKQLRGMGLIQDQGTSPNLTRRYRLIAPPLPKNTGVSKTTGVQKMTPPPKSAGVSKNVGASSRNQQASPAENSRQHRLITQDRNTQQQLEDLGIGQSTAARLIAAHGDRVLLHVEDFQIRRAAGQNIGTGWLINAIEQDYQIHAKTQAAQANRLNASRAEQRQAAHRLKELNEQAEQERIDQLTQQMFDEASDDDLEEWKQRVMKEMPTMVRGLEDADPRTNLRLKRLIQGSMAVAVS